MASKWLRISKDLQVSNFDQPDLSLSKTTKYWLELITDGSFHETSFGNKFPLYSYNIYNQFLEASSINEFNLSCNKIYDTAENVFGTNMTWIIKDTKGEELKMFFGSRNTSNGVHREDAIVDGIIFMKEFGQFRYVETIKLAIELKKCKQEYNEIWDRLKIAEDKLKGTNPKDN